MGDSDRDVVARRHLWATTNHRPWPLSSRSWRWAQTWSHLLFAHWRVPADKLRPLIPDGLTLQEFDGSAWIGVVPFLLDVRPRFVPPLPRVSRFPEINVRTYVEADGKPGIWFFSLDARNPLAVWAARRFFHLPYYQARMQIELDGEGVRYLTQRMHGPPVPEFVGSYHPSSDVFEATPGSIDHWLTERYCLYAQDPTGVLYRAEIHHPPWPLQRAEAEIEANTMVTPLGIPLPETPPLLHFARKLEVRVWPLERLGI